MLYIKGVLALLTLRVDDNVLEYMGPRGGVLVLRTLRVDNNVLRPLGP